MGDLYLMCMCSMHEYDSHLKEVVELVMEHAVC